MTPPVDRRRLLQLVESFQPTGVVWRNQLLRTRDEWIRALAAATESECRPWLQELERRAMLGPPLVQRVEIVDVPPDEPDA